MRCRVQRFLKSWAVLGIVTAAPAWEGDDITRALVAWHSGLPNGSTTDVIQVISPGFMVPANQNFEDESNYRGMTRVLNTIPLPMAKYMASASSVEDAYAMILEYKVIPPFSYSKHERKSLRRAEDVLLARRCFIEMFFNWLLGKSNTRKPSRTYTLYLKYSKSYAELTEKYQRALQSNASVKMLSDIEDEKTRVTKEWNHDDLRGRVEVALSTYNSLIELDPRITWDRIQTEYRDNQRTFASGKGIPSTSTDPAYNEWTQSNGWDALSGYIPATEVKRITIRRPWLDMRVLFSLEWTLLRSAPIERLSDGLGISSRDVWPGLMPLLPVEVILTRPVAHRDSPEIAAFVSRVVPRLPR